MYWNELRKREFYFENKKALVKFFTNKFRKLNKNSKGMNHYRIWCIHISIPPDEVTIFQFKGIKSTKWMR